jgi:iron(III) transport system permease protein
MAGNGEKTATRFHAPNVLHQKEKTGRMMLSVNKCIDGSRQWINKLSDSYFSIFLALLVLLFILLPVCAVLVKSFITPHGLGMGNYLRFFEKSYYYKALINSLVLATATTSILSLMGFVFAYLSVRGPRVISRFFKFTGMLPLVAPPFIFSLSLILLGGRNGILARVFDADINIYGWYGVILAQVITFLPIAFVMIENILKSMDSDLEDAASNLGANQGIILRDITLPLILPGILKAALLVFILAIADFGNPILIGGNTAFLATDAYLLWVGENNPHMAAVFCVFLIIPGIIIFTVHKYYLSGRVYTTIQSKPGGNAHRAISSPLLNGLLFLATPLAIIIIFCFGIIAFGAFTKLVMVNNTFTLEHFFKDMGLRAMGTSIIFALNAAGIATAMGITLSYLIIRKQIPVAGTLEFISLLGFAVPGVVMGIGYLLVFNSPTLALTGTLLIMILNEGFRNLAVGVEAGIGKLQQIDITLEDAARDMGAGRIKTFFSIILPLMSGAMVTSFVYTFMVSMVTVSAVIFLISPGKQLASVYILSVAEQGELGAACAMSMMLILVIMVCLAILKVMALFSKKNIQGS